MTIALRDLALIGALLLAMAGNVVTGLTCYRAGERSAQAELGQLLDATARLNDGAGRLVADTARLVHVIEVLRAPPRERNRRVELPYAVTP